MMTVHKQPSVISPANRWSTSVPDEGTQLRDMKLPDKDTERSRAWHTDVLLVAIIYSIQPAAGIGQGLKREVNMHIFIYNINTYAIYVHVYGFMCIYVSICIIL